MRNNLVSVLPVLLILTISGALSSAQKMRSGPEDAIRAADQHWARVFAAKDLENSVAFCAENASVLAPNAPIATGKQAIGQLFSGFFALPSLTIEWHPTKVEVARSGELGYSTGVYQMSFKDSSGKLVTDRGKYVTVWKKQADGSWRVALDIFNSDLPATAAS